MLIVWGKKYVYRHLGWVADYCGVCRLPRVFKVQRVGLAGHVYYLSLGQGELVEHERVCTHCGAILHAELADYAKVLNAKPKLEHAIKTTFPTFYEASAEALDHAQQISHSAQFLSEDARAQALANPFVYLSPKVTRRFEKALFSPVLILIMVAVILAITFAVIAVAPWMAGHEDILVAAVILLMGAALGYAYWWIGKSYMEKHVLPYLAESLRPLQPTAEELQALLVALKQAKHTIGSKVKLPALLLAIQAGGPSKPSS